MLHDAALPLLVVAAHAALVAAAAASLVGRGDIAPRQRALWLVLVCSMPLAAAFYFALLSASAGAGASERTGKRKRGPRPAQATDA